MGLFPAFSCCQQQVMGEHAQLFLAFPCLPVSKEKANDVDSEEQEIHVSAHLSLLLLTHKAYSLLKATHILHHTVLKILTTHTLQHLTQYR